MVLTKNIDFFYTRQRNGIWQNNPDVSFSLLPSLKFYWQISTEELPYALNNSYGIRKQEGPRALGRSPEEKVKGQGEAIILL